MLSCSLVKLLLPCCWLVTSVKMSDEFQCSKCPGRYCGRALTSNESECKIPCAACSRGYRSDGYFCVKCNQSLQLYDWLFLGFATLCVIVMNFSAIDVFHSSHKRVWILYALAFLETAFSFLIMILLVEPVGQFQLWTCGVSTIKDWYTLFFNPKINYVTTVSCTYEAVYPLFSSVLIYLFFSLLLMVIFRGIIMRLFLRNFGRSPLYVGLYGIPIMATVHTCLGGVFYYIFPYVTIIVSIVGSTFFLATLEEDYFKNLTRPRHLGVLLCCVLLHCYGIVSITEMKELERDGPFLLLSFLPFCFYTLTRPFTDADNFKL